MLDYRVESFLAVCQTMNFTRAANLLNLTQPAVSQHIRHLEEEFGVQLFSYARKKLQLTEAGRLLLHTATTMRHDALALRKHLAQAAQERRSYHLGATLTVAEFLLPGPLAALLRTPGLSVHLTAANTQTLLQLLDQGDIDFALVEGFFPQREYDALPFSEEAFVAVCGADYPLKRAVRRVEDLLPERLLVREQGSGTRELLQRELEQRNLSIGDFADSVQIGSIGALKALAVQGCGVTFLYRAAVQEELRRKTLRAMALENFSVSHTMHFVWRRDSVFSPEYQDFFHLLKTAAESAARQSDDV